MEEEKKVTRKFKTSYLGQCLCKFFFELNTQALRDLHNVEKIDSEFHNKLRKYVTNHDKAPKFYDAPSLTSYEKYCDLNTALSLLASSYTNGKEVQEYSKMKGVEIEQRDGSIKSEDKIWNNTQYTDFINYTFFKNRAYKRKELIERRFKNVTQITMSNIINSSWEIRHVYPYNVLYTVYTNKVMLYQIYKVSDAISALYAFLQTDKELREATKYLEDIFMHGLTISESAIKHKQSEIIVNTSIHLILNKLEQYDTFVRIFGNIDESIFNELHITKPTNINLVEIADYVYLVNKTFKIDTEEYRPYIREAKRLGRCLAEIEADRIKRMNKEKLKLEAKAKREAKQQK